MDALVILVLIVHSLLAIALIVFVLLHSGKGSGLSSMLGGMMPSTSSGTGIIEKNLDKYTVYIAVGFAITSVALMLIYRP